MDKLRSTVTGKWLVLYPDHKLTNKRQRELYGKMQDSIVGLTGLKLITFAGDGSFLQNDSIDKHGRWGISPDKMVFVEKGGPGFNSFSTRFTAFENDTLQLTEMVQAEGEKIKLVWHLKKISSDNEELFSDKRNEWRKKPAQAESEEQIKQRLSGMLHYYADYYELVADESTYFVPARVIIPFKFYQHSMGLRPLDPESYFAHRFFDTQQAEQAHRYLETLMEQLLNDFPSRDTYTKEYAAFMKSMAYEIIK